MSKGLELVKLAKENNAARFGDAFVSSVQERAAASVNEQRNTMFAKAKLAEGCDKSKEMDDDDDGDEEEIDEKEGKL